MAFRGYMWALTAELRGGEPRSGEAVPLERFVGLR